MSTDKKPVRLQVLRDKKSDRVFAAAPVSMKATGEDAPQEFKLIPRGEEVREEIELTEEQALMPPSELFAGHVVQKGRLVRLKQEK